jgi:hypothetical protein
MTRLRVLLAAALAIAAAAAFGAAASGSAGDPPSLVECARDEARRNFTALRDYTCDLTSRRTVWNQDGTLDRENVLVKKVYVKRPDRRKEVFVSGTINGKPAAKGDFWFERLGLDAETNVSDLEVFRAGMETKFRVREEGTTTDGGKTWRVLGFESLDPDKTQLQRGRMMLPADSCVVRRLTGRIVQRMIELNEVDMTVETGEVAPGIWLPTRIVIEGDIHLGWMKRRTYANNEFKNYKVNAGLDDSLFR